MNYVITNNIYPYVMYSNSKITAAFFKRRKDISYIKILKYKLKQNKTETIKKTHLLMIYL